MKDEEVPPVPVIVSYWKEWIRRVTGSSEEPFFFKCLARVSSCWCAWQQLKQIMCMPSVWNKTACFTFKSSVHLVLVCLFLFYHYIYAITHICNNPIAMDLLRYLTKTCKIWGSHWRWWRLKYSSVWCHIDWQHLQTFRRKLELPSLGRK